MCVCVCGGGTAGSLWQVVGLVWPGWGVWKARLLDKEAEEEGIGLRKEEPAFIGHLLSWQALCCITFVYHSLRYYSYFAGEKTPAWSG